MKQNTLLRLPLPLHAQLKALAAARGVSMVDVIHATIRQAVAAGELPEEVPGFKVKLHLDMDVDPSVTTLTIETPRGDFPPMSRDDATAFCEILADIKSTSDTDVVCSSNAIGGWIEQGFVGTGVELIGHNKKTGSKVRVVVTPAVAHDLARQVRNVAMSMN